MVTLPVMFLSMPAMTAVLRATMDGLLVVDVAKLPVFLAMRCEGACRARRSAGPGAYSTGDPREAGKCIDDFSRGLDPPRQFNCSLASPPPPISPRNVRIGP